MRRNSFCFAMALVTLSLFGCARIEPAEPPNTSDDSWLNGWRAEQEAPASGSLGQPADTGGSPAPENKRDIPSDWTGAVVYHADYCKPCGKLIRDLKSRAASGWKTGPGTDVHFMLVDLQKRPPNAAPQIALLPTIIYYQLGKEVARVVGYGGTEAELDAILEKHPRAKKRFGKDESSGQNDDGGTMKDESDSDSTRHGGSETFVLHPSAFLLPAAPCVCQPVPYQSSMSIGLLGFPILSHVRQGAYDPTTGLHW